MAAQSRIVIVGGGLAGAKAAQALREEGYAGQLTLFAAESHLPYERPPLSKGYLKGESAVEETRVHPQAWYPEHRVDLRLGTGVVSVDRFAHRVVTTTGEEVAYDSLLLATGASPRRIDVPGADLDGVLYLRTIDDSDRLRAAFVEDARAVVIGGGWIGLETAAAARQAGVQVTLLEAQEQPLLGVLGPEIAATFAGLHREHGVDLRTGVTVASIDAGPGSRRASAVTLEDGTTFPADVVVVGVGAAPNVDLAVAAGLDVDNGILVDAQGRSSDPDIFAAGDVANAQTPALGRRVRVEHWANALNQPAAVARGILGQPGGYDKLPYFFTDQYDLGMEYAGLAAPEDEVVVRGDLGRREFVAFWLRDGRVTAGMNVNVWDVIEDIQMLVASRARVDRSRLADPTVPIAETVSEPG